MDIVDRVDGVELDDLLLPFVVDDDCVVTEPIVQLA